MSQRYDCAIQLVGNKVKGKYEVLDTWEVLKPYFRERKPESFETITNENCWMFRSFDFFELFDPNEEKKLRETFDDHTKQFYWVRKQGTAVHGTYSWSFPLEALIRVLKANGYPNANEKNVRSSSFKGGCR